MTWASVSAGAEHTCAITVTGAAYCWGSDIYGQLSNGAVTGAQVSPSAVATPGGVTWADISAGAEHTCAVSTDGAGYCWGSDFDDQLGNGPSPSSDQPSPSPVVTPVGASWARIAAGSFASCGVTTEGFGYCWGWDNFGSLGNGPSVGSTSSPSPLDVPPTTRWSRISPGYGHTCGVTTDGAGFCWGPDSLGALGNGPVLTAAQQSPSPVDAPGTTWRAIEPALAHSCGVTTTGAGFCWGWDGFGQLGNGPVLTANQPLPSPVDTPPGVTWGAISTIEQHSCGVSTSGLAYCWGNNIDGSLGEGPGGASSRPSPTMVYKAPQTISFDLLDEVAYGGPPLTIEATASSGLAVDLVATGPCTLDGTTLTVTGVGACAVTASQDGDAIWAAAAPVEQTLTIVPGSQEITFGPLDDAVFGDPPFTVSASASSGLEVGFAASGSCAVEGAEVTITGAGSCTVTASQPGNADWLPAEPVAHTFTIEGAPATVTITGVEAVYDGQPKAVGVETDPPGLPVTVTYDGATSPPTDAGSYAVEVTVDDPDYVTDPAPVTATLVIARAPQVIEVEPIDDVELGDDPFSVTAAAVPSGLPVELAAGGACTVKAATVTPTGAGSCVLTATQPGDDNWLPAPSVTVTVEVAPARSPTTLTGPSEPSAVGTPVELTATVAGRPGTGTPSGVVTFTTDAGDEVAVAVADDGTATWTTSGLGLGTTTVTAAYDGQGDHRGSTSDPLAHEMVTGPLSLAGLPDEVAVGETVTVRATGFEPGEEVELVLRSDPVSVGTVVGDHLGAVVLTFAVPEVPAGPHTLRATGAASGLSVEATTRVLVGGVDAPPGGPGDPSAPPGPDGGGAARTPGGGPLALTGFEVLRALALALALGVAGSVLVVADRRRRAARAT